MKFDLDIETESSLRVDLDNEGKDDAITALAADKSAAMKSIIHRLKEDHYRNKYSEIGEADPTLIEGPGLKRIVNRAAVRRLCKEFGEASDRCVAVTLRSFSLQWVP